MARNTVNETHAAMLWHACLDAPTLESLLIAIGIETGARASELLTIATQDFNFADCSVFIVGLKGSLSGRYPLSIELARSINEFLGTHLILNQNKPLSTWDNDHRISTRYRRLEREFRARVDVAIGIDGIEYTLHSLRRRIGQLVYQANDRDIMAAKAILRHRSVTSTQHYLNHISLSDVTPQVAEFNKKFKKSG